MENAEENNARLHDSCMCDPVPKIKFIRARDRGCPVGNDAILPRLEKHTPASPMKRSLEDPFVKEES